MNKNFTKTKKIILAGLLLASMIILSRFLSVKTPFVKISFGSIPFILSAIILGTKYTVTIGVLADLIGAILFPTGPYFPGFTLSSALAGLIYSLALYRKDTSVFFSNTSFILRLVISSLLVNLIIYLLLNSFWLWIIQGKAIFINLIPRMIKQIVIIPLNVIIIYTITKFIQKYLPEYISHKVKLNDTNK